MSDYWTSDGAVSVACPLCGAAPGADCRNMARPEEPASRLHAARTRADLGLADPRGMRHGSPGVI